MTRHEAPSSDHCVGRFEAPDVRAASTRRVPAFALALCMAGVLLAVLVAFTAGGAPAVAGLGVLVLAVLPLVSLDRNRGGWDA